MRAEKSRSVWALSAAVMLVTVAFLIYTSTLSETVTVAHANSIPAMPLFGGPMPTFAANAGTLGAITDHAAGCDATGATPRNVTFTVSGLTAPITNVQMSMTFGSPAHTFAGDIEAVLIAPNGASHTLFGRTLATTATSCGDSSDLSGPYTFADSAAAPPNGGWWQTATIVGAAVPMTTGSYRSTAIGGAGATNPQPPTSITPAFAGVANPNGTWTLRLSDHGGGDTGAISAATLTIETPASFRTRADFDGDGKSDLSVFRPGEGTWYLNRSTDGFIAHTWGQSGDVPAPGDFDGDEKTDLSIFRPSTGTWWIIRSTEGLLTIPFGTLGDIPVVGDYNNDGRSDIAVFRPSTNIWYVQFTGGFSTFNPWGASGDIPVQGDYDGDGSTDRAVFRPSTHQWWILRSVSFGVSVTIFGAATDRPVPADYDGDGSADIAIFRPSNGQWWFRSSNTGAITTSTFGVSTDIPVPGDYDGDGRDDQAIYRDGVWWLNRSAAGLTTLPFGVSSDIPIPSKYIP